MSVTPFKIDIAEEDLADLKARLTRTRWTDAVGGAEWRVAYCRGSCCLVRGGGRNCGCQRCDHDPDRARGGSAGEKIGGVMSALALILFLPWFAILGWAYWTWPKQSLRTAARNRFDAAALLIAVALSALGMWIGMQADADTNPNIWKHVLACLYAYGAFLGVLGIAAWVRPRRRM